jgi:hypothetical protein
MFKPKRTRITKFNLKPGSRIWGDQPITEDILISIIESLYIDIEKELSNIGILVTYLINKAPLIQKCRDAIIDIINLSMVNIMFFDIIKNNNSIWEELYKHTRYSLYYIPRCYFFILEDESYTKPFCTMREFVILDTREFTLRSKIIKHDNEHKHSYGKWPIKESDSLHFRQAIFSCYIGKSYQYNGGNEEYLKEFLQYNEIVKSFDRTKSSLRKVFSIEYANKQIVSLKKQNDRIIKNKKKEEEKIQRKKETQEKRERSRKIILEQQQRMKRKRDEEEEEGKKSKKSKYK